MEDKIFILTSVTQWNQLIQTMNTLLNAEKRHAIIDIDNLIQLQIHLFILCYHLPPILFFFFLRSRRYLTTNLLNADLEVILDNYKLI